MSGKKRALRNRKVSQRMAVVDEAERKRALEKRLDALENDAVIRGTFDVASDDEEFDVDAEGNESDEDDDTPALGGGSKNKRKRKKKIDGGMRKTRGMIADKTRGPKGFKDMLEEAELDRLPEDQPSYLTATVGPPRTTSIRKFCSVCGDCSPYTCTRCGSKYCSKKCYLVHTETRCLKFVA